MSENPAASGRTVAADTAVIAGSAVILAAAASAAVKAKTFHGFEYAVLRAIPRVERGEAVNVGVLVYCQARAFLAARTRVDPARLLALDPRAELADIEAAVAAYACVCRGGATAGQAADGSPGQRFRWLTAPRSTVVQPGPVHLGVTTDPEADLNRLAELLL
jgi:hypothetical protein